MPNVPTIAARQCALEAPRLFLGEGPMWDDVAGRVRWVEISGGTVFEGDLVDGDLRVRDARQYPCTIGAVTAAGDGGLVLAGDRGLLLAAPDGTLTPGPTVVAPGVASRLNDAACDPAGRYLVGTLALDGRTGEDGLFVVDHDGTVRRLVGGLTCSNGIGFSPDGTTLYLVDSIPGIVRAFDYDAATGSCGTGRLVSSEGPGLPDGLAVDVDGNLWVAYFGGAQVRCLDPDGRLVSVVELPVPQVTCPAFVGPERDLLLVTTAREHLDDAGLARWPESGGLFLAHVGTTGLPVTPWSGSTLRQTGADAPAPPVGRTTREMQG
jgi:sugar lactone lactonase YvrE